MTTIVYPAVTAKCPVCGKTIRLFEITCGSWCYICPNNCLGSKCYDSPEEAKEALEGKWIKQPDMN